MEKDETKLLKKIITFIENYSPSKYSIVLTLPVFVFILGFFIWNIYLYTFGFLEEEFLRAKFILSGTTFLIVTYFVAVFFILIRDLIIFSRKLIYKFFSWLFKISKNIIWFNKICFFLFNLSILDLWEKAWFFINKFLQKEIFYPIYVLLFLLWLGFYAIYLFPIVPPLIGGGQPRSISLLAISTNMQILNSLGIVKGEGADYQTENLCVVHENSHSVYILRSDRVLMVDRSLIQGFGSLPGKRSIYEQDCIQYARSWSSQGFLLSSLLSYVSTNNLIRETFGWPQIYFDIPDL